MCNVWRMRGRVEEVPWGVTVVVTGEEEWAEGFVDDDRWGGGEGGALVDWCDIGL